MSGGPYRRVIPRDLFNEGNLLKCYGRLAILLGEIPAWGHRAVLGPEDVEAFEIVQNPGDGSLTVANLRFEIGGEPYRLSRPLNARDPWPLYATGPDDEETAVFSPDGHFTDAFRVLIGTKQC